ncbi:MAG: transcriptional regulator [Caulobacterales bacterium 32-69-10]|nr:MAG: transcriptional regulator [Caulobacterales bacterium 32-69-10]
MARKPKADRAPIESVLTRIKVTRQGMAPVAGRLADYILEDPARIVRMSVTEVAEAATMSFGAVVKFAKDLGLDGFQALKLSLAQESVRPVQYIHEDLDPSDDLVTATQKIFHSGIQALSDTLTVLDPKAMARAVEIFRSARQIEIYGIGSAKPIAEDAGYRMLRIGLNPRVVVDSHEQAISASLADPGVATLTISHSGATVETLAATRLAKEAGAKTVVITNFGKSPIQAHADVVLFTMARETTFRTEAMASRIAQLCVVDALIANLALADYDRAVGTLKHTFETLSIKRI